MLPVVDPTKTKSWQQLLLHYNHIKDVSLKYLFQDKRRAEKYTCSFQGLHLDYSKHPITEETLSLLAAFSQEMQLQQSKEALYQGKSINITEKRAVLHVALRRSLCSAYQDQSYKEKFDQELAKVQDFVRTLHHKQRLGFQQEPIHTIVNIGIGGSDLGAKMAVRALKQYAHSEVKTYFVSNIDAEDILAVLKKCKPQHTLFIIASKSFRTEETLVNAEVAKEWLRKAVKDEASLAQHLVAITSAREEARKFGVTEENIFDIDPSVNGRFSMWSNMGLVIAASIGFQNFEKFLEGGKAMDEHFLCAEPLQNMPLLLALLSIWHVNFFDRSAHAVLCYSKSLELFPAFLQQLSMESNGKSVDRAGQTIHYHTAPVLLGAIGTDSEHSFHQLLHQGTRIVPCDFILFKESAHALRSQHERLLAHGFAQSAALMSGRKHGNLAQSDKSIAYRTFQGGRPSTTILLDQLSPYTLGLLVALYEHKVFCEGMLWNIYSFDQWGVELGKELASTLRTHLHEKKTTTTLDCSTENLLKKYFAKNYLAI